MQYHYKNNKLCTQKKRLHHPKEREEKRRGGVIKTEKGLERKEWDSKEI